MNLVDQYAYKYSTVVPRSAQHRRKIHGSRVGVAFSFLGCSFPHGEFVRQRRERRGWPWPSPSWAFAPRAPITLFRTRAHPPGPVPHPRRSHLTRSLPFHRHWHHAPHHAVAQVQAGGRGPHRSTAPCRHRTSMWGSYGWVPHSSKSEFVRREKRFPALWLLQ